MRVQLLRFANRSGISLIPDPFKKVIDYYCKQGNLIHLESGSLITEPFLDVAADLIYIKTYNLSDKGISFNSFLCVPKLNSTKVDFIPAAEFSNNFMMVNMSFNEDNAKTFIDLIKSVHNKPAITLNQFMLN